MIALSYTAAPFPIFHFGSSGTQSTSVLSKASFPSCQSSSGFTFQFQGLSATSTSCQPLSTSRFPQTINNNNNNNKTSTATKIFNSTRHAFHQNTVSNDHNKENRDPLSGVYVDTVTKNTVTQKSQKTSSVKRGLDWLTRGGPLSDITGAFQQAANRGQISAHNYSYNTSNSRDSTFYGLGWGGEV